MNKRRVQKVLELVFVMTLVFGIGAGVNYAAAQQVRSSNTGSDALTRDGYTSLDRAIETSRSINSGNQNYQPLNMGPDAQSKQGPLVINRNKNISNFGLMVPFGKVGIGTIKPSEVTSRLTIRDDSGGAFGQFNFNAIVSTPYKSFFNMDDLGLRIGHDSNSRSIQFFTGNALGGFDPKMIIRPSGNIGIGTMTPSATLHTVGSVKMEGIPYLGSGFTGNSLFIKDNGELVRGETTKSGTIQVPLNSQWSAWENLSFAPQVVAFSGLNNPNKNCVIPPTFTLPPADGSSTAWVYTACNGVDKIQLMTLEKSGNNIRVKFDAPETHADLNFTAFK